VFRRRSTGARTGILNRASLLPQDVRQTFAASAQIDDATKQLSHDIFKELIEINTTDSVGNVTTASEAMAKRLLDAGFPAADVQVLGPNDRKKNMVARLRGSGKKKPILLIGHLDVVEAMDIAARNAAFHGTTTVSSTRLPLRCTSEPVATVVEPAHEPPAAEDTRLRVPAASRCFAFKTLK
jgi:hypothetical protein